MHTRGVHEPEWTPTGVLPNFDNWGGAGVKRNFWLHTMYACTE